MDQRNGENGRRYRRRSGTILKRNSRARGAGSAERLDARNLLALEPLQKSAAGCRYVGKILRRAGLIEGRDGIAAAGDGFKRAHLGELRRDLGDRHRAGLKWRDLESADGSVPDE